MQYLKLAVIEASVEMGLPPTKDIVRLVHKTPQGNKALSVQVEHGTGVDYLENVLGLTYDQIFKPA